MIDDLGVSDATRQGDCGAHPQQRTYALLKGASCGISFRVNFRHEPGLRAGGHQRHVAGIGRPQRTGRVIFRMIAGISAYYDRPERKSA
jgi:hypothetical protein